jgi:hypothetical protein
MLRRNHGVALLPILFTGLLVACSDGGATTTAPGDDAGADAVSADDAGTDGVAPTPDAALDSGTKNDAAVGLDAASDAGSTRLCDGYQLLTPADFQVTAPSASGGSCAFSTPFNGTVDCQLNAGSGNHAAAVITVPSASDFCATFDMEYVGNQTLNGLVKLFGAVGDYTQGTVGNAVYAVDGSGLRNYGDSWSQTYATASLQDPVRGDVRIKKNQNDLVATQVRLYPASSTVVALNLGNYSSFGAPNGTLNAMQIVLGPEHYFLASNMPAVHTKYTNVLVYKK